MSGVRVRLQALGVALGVAGLSSAAYFAAIFVSQPSGPSQAPALLIGGGASVTAGYLAWRSERRSQRESEHNEALEAAHANSHKRAVERLETQGLLARDRALNLGKNLAALNEGSISLQEYLIKLMHLFCDFFESPPRRLLLIVPNTEEYRRALPIATWTLPPSFSVVAESSNTGPPGTSVSDVGDVSNAIALSRAKPPGNVISMANVIREAHFSGYISIPRSSAVSVYRIGVSLPPMASNPDRHSIGVLCGDVSQDYTWTEADQDVMSACAAFVVRGFTVNPLG